MKPGAGQEAELRGVLLRGLAVEGWLTFVFVDEALLEEACGAVDKLDDALSQLFFQGTSLLFFHSIRHYFANTAVND